MPVITRLLIALTLVMPLAHSLIAAEAEPVDVVIDSRKDSWNLKEAWFFDVTMKNQSDASLEVPFIYDAFLKIDGVLYTQFPKPRVEGIPKLMIGSGKEEKATLTLNGKGFQTLDAKTGSVPLKLGVGDHTLQLILGTHRSKEITFKITE